MRIHNLHLRLILLHICSGWGLVSAWWSWTESANQLKPLASLPDDDHPLFSAQIAMALKSAELAKDHSEVLKLVAQARDEMMEPSCWHHAYASLFADCRQIINDEEKKVRLALKLTDCFLRASGRPSLAPCTDLVAVSKCTQSMDEHVSSIYLAFFIDIASACHLLQTQAFILETKLVSNILKSDADTLGGTLSKMEQQSSQIYDHALTIIDVQKKLKDDQAVVQQGIIGIQNDFDAGATILKSYVKLTHEQLENAISIQEKFSDEQEEMNKQQQQFSEYLAVEFSNLKSKTGQVSDSIKLNLIGQGELLSGQAAAMASLDVVVKLHIAAAEEVRSYIQSIAKEDLKNRQELQAWQRQLEVVSVEMGTFSTSMRSCQDSLSLRASHMFSLIENLFSLNLAIVYGSQTFRAFLFYATILLLVLLVTAAKETSDKRELLICASCVTLSFELLLLYNVKLDVFIEQTVIFWLRGLFLIPAWVLLVNAYLTYKDEDRIAFVRFQAIQKRLMEGQLDELVEKGGPSYCSPNINQIYSRYKSHSRKILSKALSFQRRKRRMVSK